MTDLVRESDARVLQAQQQLVWMKRIFLSQIEEIIAEIKQQDANIEQLQRENETLRAEAKQSQKQAQLYKQQLDDLQQVSAEQRRQLSAQIDELQKQNDLLLSNHFTQSQNQFSDKPQSNKLSGDNDIRYRQMEGAYKLQIESLNTKISQLQYNNEVLQYQYNQTKMMSERDPAKHADLYSQNTSFQDSADPLYSKSYTTCLDQDNQGLRDSLTSVQSGYKQMEEQRESFYKKQFRLREDEHALQLLQLRQQIKNQQTQIEILMRQRNCRQIGKYINYEQVNTYLTAQQKIIKGVMGAVEDQDKLIQCLEKALATIGKISHEMDARNQDEVAVQAKNLIRLMSGIISYEYDKYTQIESQLAQVDDCLEELRADNRGMVALAKPETWIAGQQ